MTAIDRATKALQAVLTELRAEREDVDSRINSLEASLTMLGAPAPKRRGRPKGSKNKPKAMPAVTKSKRRTWTPAMREAQAAKLKAAWKRRKAAVAKK